MARAATATREPLATRKEVAAYLGIAVKTLKNWAVSGKGPKYVKVGSEVRYRWQDIDAYVESRRVSHGGELSEG